MIRLDPGTAALVMIDLQKGILGRELAPRSGAEIVAGAKTLAAKFRAAGAKIVWVTVGWEADFGDALKTPVDAPMARPAGGLPADFAALAEGLAAPGDLHVRKRQWGAFYGTDLDLQLRRRGIDTIALGGVATNFGVESTARAAWEHGYAVVVLEDLCASMAAEHHAFAVSHIFPRIARVRTSAEIELEVLILAEIGAAAEAAGLTLRGGLRLDEAERIGPLAPARTVLLLGFVGARGWPVFAASAEAGDGRAHPLDRWSRRVVSGLARTLRRDAAVPVRGAAVLAVPGLGRAGRAAISLAARGLHPSPLRALAQLSRRAGLRAGDRPARARRGAKPLRHLRRAAVPFGLSRRRLHRRRL